MFAIFHDLRIHVAMLRYWLVAFVISLFTCAYVGNCSTVSVRHIYVWQVQLFQAIVAVTRLVILFNHVYTGACCRMLYCRQLHIQIVLELPGLGSFDESLSCTISEILPLLCDCRSHWEILQTELRDDMWFPNGKRLWGGRIKKILEYSSTKCI